MVNLSRMTMVNPRLTMVNPTRLTMVNHQVNHQVNHGEEPRVRINSLTSLLADIHEVCGRDPQYVALLKKSTAALKKLGFREERSFLYFVGKPSGTPSSKQTADKKELALCLSEKELALSVGD